MNQATGFQDYNRLSIQAGAVLYRATGPLNTIPGSPVIDAGGFGYINIVTGGGLLQSDAYRISVQWFIDKAQTFLLASQDISCLGGGQEIQVPAIGRWFTVITTFFSGVGTDTLTIMAIGSNVYTPRLAAQLRETPYIYVNQNIAGSTTLTFDGITTVPGEAVWSVLGNTNAQWVAELSFYSISTATYLGFAFMYGAILGNAGISRVELPFSPIRMTIENVAAGAQLFIAALTTSVT